MSRRRPSHGIAMQGSAKRRSGLFRWGSTCLLRGGVAGLARSAQLAADRVNTQTKSNRSLFHFRDGAWSPRSKSLIAGIASCCQEIRTTPSTATAAATSCCSSPSEKSSRSFSRPMSSANGSTVCWGRELLLWGANATCKDHEWLLDALISEVSIWGCEECGPGSRTLPTANSEFLRSLVPLNGDAKNGARVIRLFRVANNHNLAGRHLPAPD